MIPIPKQPEPAGFNSNVRKRGAAFLKANPAPLSHDFKAHQYWKWAATELYEAYHRTCAYSCVYIPMSPGTIDHFVPKTRRPDLAYEWDNYRLALHRMNMYKADRTDIADPFAVRSGWFVLDFPSCLVRPGANLTPDEQRLVQTTISALKLNDDDGLVQERCDIMLMFARGDVGLGFLQKRYPFLAAEITRQNLMGTAATVFKTRV